jgi:pimeloyl-ACP methyl ester carboxylesterase
MTHSLRTTTMKNCIGIETIDTTSFKFNKEGKDKKRLLLLILTVFLILLWTKTVNAEGRFYKSPDGTKIHYEVKGSGDAIVLIHGFISDGNSWKRTALYTDLISAGYKVILMDLRGNGKSDKPHQPELYENDVEAKDIMGIVTELDIKEYTAVGYSRGSILTTRLLVLDKRVTRAVIGGMGLDFTNPDWPRRIMFYEALVGKPVKELEGFVKYVKDSGLDQQAQAYLQKSQPSTSKKALSEIEKPVLIISGTDDTENGSAKDLAAVFPNAIYATVPGDHGSAVRTEEFSTAVIQFLNN